MAYEATITWKQEVHKSGRRLILRIVETDAGTGSAWTTVHSATNIVESALNPELDQKGGRVIPMPASFTVRNWKQELISGTGTTVHGMIGCPETPGSFTDDTMDLLYHTDAAAAFIHEAGISTVAFPPDRTRRELSGMSRVDAGTDNVIHTLIVLDSVL